MKRVGALAAVAVFGAGLLAGCGDNPENSAEDRPANGTKDYCETLADAKEEFSSLDEGDVAAFERFREVADDLEAAAPEEVADDWKTLTDSFDDLETKLGEAGITFEDLEGISQGQLPEGVTQQDLMQLGEELKNFGPGLEKAGDNITKHAKSECDIVLE